MNQDNFMKSNVSYRQTKHDSIFMNFGALEQMNDFLDITLGRERVSRQNSHEKSRPPITKLPSLSEFMHKTTML